jgi:nicotinamide-nucleotide amidase
MHSLRAEVISIGDELTSGQRLDTNSQWLSQRLAELGVTVMFHTTVADDLEANVQVFRQAVERADLVVATGGLGPTADDLTREAIARVMGVELALDEPSLAHIRRLFSRRKRDMPERNVVQAMFPVGSRPIPNPEGTAPGVAATIGRHNRAAAAHVFALPGVPAEMVEMWEQTVAPAIRALGGGGTVIRHQRIKCFGVGESDLEQMLPDLIRRGRVPQVGITVSGATITLRITATGRTAEECTACMQPTIDTIHHCLGSIVFGEEEDELEHAVARLLVQKGQTLATIEWGTGGQIAHWLSEVPQARERYLGGLVVTSRQMLMDRIDVPAKVIEQHGVVSRQVTEAMAVGVQRRLECDYALAVSEFPVYTPEAAEPEPVFFALASPQGVVVRQSPFAGHPSILKIRAAKQALNLLRLALLNEPTG